MKRLLLLLLLTVSLNLAAQPLWMRYNVISPQGDKIAFCYKGDVYVVGTQGGRAQQITTNSSYESNPIWSPDGKTLAFSSDRNGNFDVYTVPVEGGVAQRVTTNSATETPLAFSPDGNEIYFTAQVQKQAENIQFAVGWITELYKVNAAGGRPEQVVAVPVSSMSFDKDGKSFLYYDRKGSENIWRKHHVSSVARDVVYYNAEDEMHTIMTTNVGEDRDPRYLPGYDEVVFLSERNNGNFNVYKAPAKNLEQVEQVTSFETHPVRFLSVAGDGTLCYGYMGEIYTQRIGQAPKKVDIQIVNDQETAQWEKKDFGGINDFDLSQDGKLIAFCSRGEIFVTGTDEYGTSKQITNTVQPERNPSFSKDGRSLVYASERDGYWNLYQATIERKEDYNFVYATLIDEKPLFDNDGVERIAPTYSPDGKEIAFIENRNVLKVYNIETKEVRQITDGRQHYDTDDYGFSYKWSPDSKWFVLTLVTNMRDPYSDIGIVKADGSKKIYNITESAYIDSNPHWAMDGNAIIYVSNRYGMRSHASWGSQNDVFIAFMNQDAYDKFKMSKEEYDLMKEIEKDKKDLKKDDKKDEPAKEEKSAKKGVKKGKKKGDSDEKNADEKPKEAKPLEIDLEHLQDRVVRLTPMSSSLSGVALSKDGDKLYFMSSFEKGYDLWEMDVREKSMKILKKIGKGGAQLKMDKKGENVFVLSGGNLQSVSVKGGKSSSIKYDATMKLNRADEREYMFDHVFLQIDKRFFMKDHHGVDLEMMKTAYRPFLEHINNNYDFSEMLSEILGELNVSHTGSGYRPGGRGDATAEFGVLLDLRYDGDGLKIDEVVEGSPFDKKTSKVKAGCIIEKIDGEAVEAGKDYYPMLNNKAGKQVLVEVYDPSTKNRWTETVKPISHGTMNNLLYDRWVKHNEETVKELSNGRLGYVHIKSMGDASYRDVYSQILGKYNLCDGIVIDTRFNGGGRLHEDIEVLFSGEKYLEQVINDSVACVMPSRRYNKPSVMIIGEANYSNAHGTPWVYKHKGMGSLVGMPVPGTMSSVTWETLQDPSLYFGLPVVGYRTEQGNWLENTQLEPDVKVRNTPEKMAAGVDEQLEAAVKELQREVNKFQYWGK
ncbi:MAG: PDZ domain-containing protein [Bacteroidales bacterium]|nr:PDZ domain-containing protein [Bacteroidales bacterium]